MTLVATWKDRGTPYLIGDILISRVGVEGDNISLPTRDDLNEILPKEWLRTLVGMCQKVYVVSDTFAVGWAEHRLTAKIVIREILETFCGKTPSLDEVKAFLNGLADLKDFECIILSTGQKLAKPNKSSAFQQAVLIA